jgi:DNA-binding NarL/FixJ family response regulator
MKTMEKQIFEYAQGEQSVPDEHTSALIRYFDLFSSITTGSLYVLDIPRKQFCCVKPDSLFLCGYSAGDALGQGYDFYSKIIHPGDLSLWTAMRKAVLRYLNDFEEKRDETDYFSCTFRLQRKHSLPLPHPLPQMIYQRMKPVWVDNELRYLICSVEDSTVKKTGNLCMYGKDGLTYETYNFRTGRWKCKREEPLTEREKMILMLAREGKSSVEIAGDLCKGQSTVRNQIKALFAKLNVHSMQEAIEFACYHRMMYPLQDRKESQPVEAPRKRTRILLTEDMLQRIQQSLDEGKSIRQAAKREGISEHAVRYWKGKGIITKSE